MRYWTVLISIVIFCATDGLCQGSCNQLSLSDLSNNFMLKLLKVILGSEKKCTSLIVSTFNIEQVMVEVTNAACGKTLDELKNYFGICNLNSVNSQFKNYINQMQIKQKDSQGKTEALVNLFSGIFVQKDFPVKQSYIDLLKNYFSSIAENLDFAKQPDQAQNILNRYINVATYGLFPKFFNSPLPTDTVILELAVIYFYSQWPRGYFYFDNTERTFNCDNSVQKAQYINNHNAEKAAGYAEKYGFKIVSLPYVTSDYSMLLMLPLDSRQDPGTLLKNLDHSKLSDIFDATEKQDECTVNITIPRFEIKYKLDNLVDIFQQGGVKSLFNKADFCNGVDQSQVAGNLKVNKIIHQAYISLNQNATIAAAVTAVEITTTAIRICENPKQFYANRPFAFIIKNNKLNTCVFIGICSSPNYALSKY